MTMTLLITFSYDFFRFFLYKIKIGDINKTMQVVCSYKGLVLLDIGLHGCMSVSIDGHVPKGIACHEIKATCG